MKAQAQQVTLDLYHCDIEQLNDKISLKLLIETAMNNGSMPIVLDHIHDNSEPEFTIVAISVDGHLTMHSYPNLGFLALDIFSSNPNVNPEKVAIEIKAALKPESSKMTYLQRGTSATDMKPRRKSQTKPMRKVKNAGQKVFNALTNKRPSYMD